MLPSNVVLIVFTKTTKILKFLRAFWKQKSNGARKKKQNESAELLLRHAYCTFTKTNRRGIASRSHIQKVLAVKRKKSRLWPQIWTDLRNQYYLLQLPHHREYISIFPKATSIDFGDTCLELELLSHSMTLELAIRQPPPIY